MINNKNIIMLILTLVIFILILFPVFAFNLPWIASKIEKVYLGISSYFESPKEKEFRIKKKEEQNRDNYRKHFFSKLICNNPSNELSNSELYELAMDDYWKYQVEKISDWDNIIQTLKDEKLILDDTPYDLNRKICGLRNINEEKSNEINSTCYPWLLYEYNDLNIIQKWESKNYKISDFKSLVSKEWSGISFNPFEDRPYKGKYFNRETPFAVIQRSYDGVVWYPKDCCRLLEYSELKSSHDFIHTLYLIEKFMSLEELNKIKFLVIKTYNLDRAVSSYTGLNMLGRSNNYAGSAVLLAYPVTYCGKITPFIKF